MFFQNLNFLFFTGVALSAWIIFGSMGDLFSRLKNIYGSPKNLFSNTSILNRIEIGKNMSHMGVGLLIFGIAAVSTLEEEIIKEVKIGDKFTIGNYEITFKGVQRQTNFN